ncbi:unnamed protein product [Hymenolepis diminuta]|uniref:RCC1-like domain-containing protein n=1 Tax=Hymenolepis diminuta TaxID=6216 RepID=A0A564YT51_HYMDI|nr:unnamed protein product [Hymenolepis diminuta]
MVLRTRKRQSTIRGPDPTKRRRVDSSVEELLTQLKILHSKKYSIPGIVLTFGSGDTGQLGLGPDTTERTKPARFNPKSLKSAGLTDETAENFVQVEAGGMHTLCLDNKGRVFSFGCNDEGALGRPSTDTPPEEGEIGGPVEESRPGIVTFPEDVTITMISAGDSHSAALDSTGRVWLWGTFRGANGAIGLTKDGEISRAPVLLSSFTDRVVMKIASGQDHLVCLTDEGLLFTMGCGEQGQLGRIAERFAKDGGRNGIDLLLQPGECRIRGFKRFSDVWAGGFTTIARCAQTGVIYACGLNNYGQLALVKQPQKLPTTAEVKEELSESMLAKKQGPLIQFMLTPANGFDPEKNWTQFAIGMHHTLALTESGEVYAVGRSDYGRLGFPAENNSNSSDRSAVPEPHLVQGLLRGRRCSWVGAGESCSYAVDDAGKAFSWGMGSSQQLAQEEEDEDALEPGEMIGRNLEGRRIIMVDAGGQHAVMLAAGLSRGKAPDAAAAATTSSTETSVSKKNHNHTTTQSAPESMDTDNVPVDTTEIPVSNGGNMMDKTTPPVNSTTVSSATNPPPEVASTAGATVNSSSVHSCSLVPSDQSSLSSNHSTDGGGSSRMGSSIFAQPIDAPLSLSKAGTSSTNQQTTSANCGGSNTSTSEAGLALTETGSNTASPSNTH